ncbi:hypothetical protein CEXT_407701 [Caerostris extrusa]|uniref:Uncharacterized protein n=1 Tax=Caerostris extrusa TaxID=172846 RepID=A0AAV4MT87_CAEEX|nr:hypothetical protein CEXT_407701 [Caerostris extrusa]
MLFTGSKTQQHRCEVRLHLEDPGFRAGSDGRHHLYDDPIRSDQILQSPGGHSRHGIQRQRFCIDWDHQPIPPKR